ncbi:unnamed protein product [Eruca vesicaria subsp. sativa]|uniref:PORR domain-containing protein n=1 Tax=Eruca vesicaria subsp. sativa TaxID=29727 RepID=A0ABC8LFE1_ERUVS|nr:unnamed protein product [Eruca vesicaria subsp. sativa]
MLPEKAQQIAAEEGKAIESMEPDLVNKLRKLLIMSADFRVPLEKVEFIQSVMGLPLDFKSNLIPKYPDFFSLKVVYKKVHLEPNESRKKVRITKDGKSTLIDSLVAAAGIIAQEVTDDVRI